MQYVHVNVACKTLQLQCCMSAELHGSIKGLTASEYSEFRAGSIPGERWVGWYLYTSKRKNCACKALQIVLPRMRCQDKEVGDCTFFYNLYTMCLHAVNRIRLSGHQIMIHSHRFCHIACVCHQRSQSLEVKSTASNRHGSCSGGKSELNFEAESVVK